MAQLIHDLCGKRIEEEEIHQHRLKCYVKDQPHGFHGYVENGKIVIEPDPKKGGRMLHILNGKVVEVERRPLPTIVTETEESNDGAIVAAVSVSRKGEGA